MRTKVAPLGVLSRLGFECSQSQTLTVCSLTKHFSASHLTSFPNSLSLFFTNFLLSVNGYLETIQNKTKSIPIAAQVKASTNAIHAAI